MTIIQPVKGTRDFYPEEMAIRKWLYTNIQNVSELFGFQEYEGPILEPFSLYVAKSGEDLVKENFAFPDRDFDARQSPFVAVFENIGPVEEHLGHLVANRGPFRQPGQVFKRRVDKNDARPGIGDHNSIPHVLQNGLAGDRDQVQQFEAEQAPGEN